VLEERARPAADQGRAREDPAHAGVFEQRYVKKLQRPQRQEGQDEDGPRRGSSCARTSETFKKTHGCDRLVAGVVRLDRGLPRADRRAPESLAAFEKGLRESTTRTSPRAQIYAYAAIKEGVPYANGAPNLSATSRLLELAAPAGVPIAGKDFKTGQTLMKTILAPGFKARLLGLAAGSRPTSSATATARCSTIPSRSRPRR
jgi:myo-inositol-1-phosphate synthase